MIYGYARVSTAAQGRDGNSLEEQVAALQKYGCHQIVEEAFSGKTMERPKFKKLLKILKELKMNGLLLADEEVVSAMDGSLESLPVSFNKDGSFSKRSSVASREQFSILQSYVKKKIGDIQKSIMTGDVNISPYEMGARNACTYCPYKSVCGFDRKLPGYEYRRLKQFSDKDLWNNLKEEVQWDGNALDR